MKRYRFRLQSVLRVREIQENVAAANLALANRDLAAAEAALTARRSAYAALDFQRGVQSSSAFLAAREHDGLKAQTVLEAGQQVTASEEAADGRRAEWTDAAAKVTALENLDGRQREDHALDALRADATVIDDIVIGQHRSKR